MTENLKHIRTINIAETNNWIKIANEDLGVNIKLKKYKQLDKCKYARFEIRIQTVLENLSKYISLLDQKET